jgi:outer membrane receptor protein involved in Fe transport
MMNRVHFLLSAATCAIVSLATPARAQEGAPPAGTATPQEVAAEEDIVVTGSRVARAGFDAPTPTTVLSAEALANRGLSNVGDFLNEIPSFRPSQSNQTNTQSASATGANFADLRALGNIRTLALVDGRRHVPSAATGQFDLNLIPTILIERVDVVTGGASAAYGSDAISGVVNIVLNKRLQGFRGDLSLGIAEAGDNFEHRVSLAFGTDFAEGRGHFVLGGDYVKSDGVGSFEDRDWSRRYEEIVSFANTRPAGTPSRIYASGVQFVNSLPGGLIVGNNADTTASNGADVLRGIWFPLPGVVSSLTYGQEAGGSSYNFSSSVGTPPRLGHTLVLPIDRHVVMAHLAYELGDAIDFFAEGSYGRAGSQFSGPIPRDTALTGANALIIRRDNAFLPAQVAAIMDANGITSFPLGRTNPDSSSTWAVNSNTTYRIAAGLRGDLGAGWSWDVYGQYGHNKFDSEIRNMRIQQNYLFAYDAIRVGGQIVCRNETARANGCMPLNLFGIGAGSQAALDYVNGTQFQTIEISQKVAAANVRGEPFSTWAGPVSLAFGGEYREDKARSVVDSIAEAKGYNFSNPAPFVGSFTTKEAYAEVVVPLASEMPLLHALELNGAVRYTHYSSSGGVTTWKLGATWEPFEGLRLRGTRSRDIRAPNSAELFSQTSTNATVRNPFSGASRPYAVITASSPNLQPEFANTLSFGTVWSPDFLPGLSLSVDYYNIKIDGAISSYTAQNVIDNCFAERQAGTLAGPFCSSTQLSGSGAATEIVSITTQLLNLASLKTSGFDFELAYRFPAFSGHLSTRFYGTYVDRLVSDDGLGVAKTYNAAGIIQTKGSVIDRAGQVGGFTSGLITGATSVPHWQLNGSLTYDNGPWATTFTGRYIGGGVVDATLVGPGDSDYNALSPISVAPNKVASRFYLNWTGSVSILETDARKLQFYAVVNNLLDRDPPFPNTQLAGFYDRLGRSYKVGLRFTY